MLHPQHLLASALPLTCPAFVEAGAGGRAAGALRHVRDPASDARVALGPVEVPTMLVLAFADGSAEVVVPAGSAVTEGARRAGDLLPAWVSELACALEAIPAVAPAMRRLRRFEDALRAFEPFDVRHAPRRHIGRRVQRVELLGRPGAGAELFAERDLRPAGWRRRIEIACDGQPLGLTAVGCSRTVGSARLRAGT